MSDSTGAFKEWCKESLTFFSEELPLCEEEFKDKFYDLTGVWWKVKNKMYDVHLETSLFSELEQFYTKTNAFFFSLVASEAPYEAKRNQLYSRWKEVQTLAKELQINF